MLNVALFEISFSLLNSCKLFPSDLCSCLWKLVDHDLIKKRQSVEKDSNLLIQFRLSCLNQNFIKIKHICTWMMELHYGNYT